MYNKKKVNENSMKHNNPDNETTKLIHYV